MNLHEYQAKQLYADYGIAGGKSEGVIFKHGEPVARVASDRLADALVELIERENQ